MNSIIEAWNSGARVWWSWCLHSTWQGLVLLVLVLAVLPLLKRVSPHWRYALLLVVSGYGLFLKKNLTSPLLCDSVLPD